MVNALSINPPGRTTLKAAEEALTLKEVSEEIEGRASLNYPDTLVPMPQVQITDDGLVHVPSLGTLALNSWSRTQFSRMLGIRWDKWFSPVVSPSKRKEEIEYRLSKESREWKIRARRYAPGENGPGDGILRAFLSPGYQDLDDTRVFSRLALVLNHHAHDLGFIRHEVTDEHSFYVALDRTIVDLGNKETDVHYNGFIIVNSEVGASALSLFEYLWRLVCQNGLIMLTQGEKLFRKVHRQQEDESIDRDLAYALALLPQRWKNSEKLVRRAKWLPVEKPEDTLRSLLADSPEVKPYIEAVVESYQAEPDPSRFGLVQAMTRTAQTLTPEERFLVERFAGEVLASPVQ